MPWPRTQLEVRLRVVGYARRLLDSCAEAKQRAMVLREMATRIRDEEERVRCASVAAFCDILAAHPEVRASGHAAAARAGVWSWLAGRC